MKISTSKWLDGVLVLVDDECKGVIRHTQYVDTQAQIHRDQTIITLMDQAN